METSRKFLIAKPSIRKLGSSSELTIITITMMVIMMVIMMLTLLALMKIRAYYGSKVYDNLRGVRTKSYFDL